MRVTGEGPPYVKVRRRVIYDRFDLDDWAAKRKRRFTGETIEEPQPGDDPAPAPGSERPRSPLCRQRGPAAP